MGLGKMRAEIEYREKEAAQVCYGVLFVWSVECALYVGGGLGCICEYVDRGLQVSMMTELTPLTNNHRRDSGTTPTGLEM